MSSISIDSTATLHQAIAGSPTHRAGSGAAWAVARLRAVLVALAVPALVVALWWWAAAHAWMSEQILPPPAYVWDTALDLIRSGQVQEALAVSFGRLVAGLAIGGGLGLAAGVAMGLSRRTEAYLGPTLRAICLVPSLGWLPFFMLAFGIGEGLKFALIAKTCFMPMMVNGFEGTRAVPVRYREVARVLELGRFATLRYVVLPAALPALTNGFRLALSKGWKALVLVEMIASAAGIGYLMTWGRKAFQLDVVLVTMVVIGIAGWALDRAALVLSRRYGAWSERTTL
ncbi:MAG: ABC transporter permease [Pseudomonadota bacterium]